MDLKTVQTFVSVARLLSFRKSASVLHYAQSTVSAQIQGLEEELGVRLFDRLDRGIRLTEAGQRFLPYALKLLDLAGESVSAAAGPSGASGSLIIRMPETLAAYRFPLILARFLESHPGIELRLRSSAGHGLRANLEKGLDLAFLLSPRFTSQGVRVERLGSEELVLVTGAGQGLSPGARVRANDLDARTILTATTDCACGRMLGEYLAERDAAPGNRLDFSSLAALRNSLAMCHGFALLPRVVVADDLAAGRLVALDLEDGPREVARLMLWHQEKWISPPLAALMDNVREAWGGEK